MGAAPERLIIFGSGGHARVVLEAALARWPACEIGVLDDSSEAIGRTLLGYPVLGDRSWLDSNWPSASVMPAIGGNSDRAALLSWLARCSRSLATVIHPSAVVSPSAQIVDGVFVGPGAVINAQARIGRGAIVNTSASIDHDCIIGECAHIGPGTNLCGGVTVEEGALLGVGCAVIPNVRIGSRAVVGAGSSVIRNVADGARVGGCPARLLVRRGVPIA